MEEPKTDLPKEETETNIQTNDSSDPMVSEASPVAEPATPVVTDKPKRSRRLGRKQLVIIAILVLAIGGGASAFLLKKDKPAQTTNQPIQSVSLAGKDLPVITNTSFADKFVPEYSDMRGYAEFGGERWYVAFKSIIITKNGSYRVINPDKFDGIDTFTGVAVVDGKLWVSGQGGLARYDASSNTFKTYLKGELNVAISIDPYTSDLYVSTFNKPYVYNKKSDSFTSIGNGDPYVGEFGFSKNYILAVAGGRSQSNPTQVFNRQTKQWSTPSGLAYSAGDKQSSSVNALTIENKTITFGRDARYESCASAGKYPATVVYQFNDDGTLTELKDLTNLFSKNEAHISNASRTSLKGSDLCEGGKGGFLVDLKIQNGTVTATNKRASDESDAFAGYLYSDRMDQLEKELGFAKQISLEQSLPNNTVFSNWLSVKTSSLVSTTGADKNVKNRTSLDDFGGLLTYVECGGAQYVLNTTGKTGAFNAPFLVSILKLEGTKSTEVYETTNKPLYEGVDAEISLANSEAVCSGNTLLILGTDQLYTFDLTTKTLKKQALGATTDMEASLVNKDRNGFNFVDIERLQLVRVGADIAQKKTVPLTKSALFATTDASLQLYAFNDTYAVIGQRSYKEQGSRIVTFKVADGSVVENTKIAKGVSDGAPYDNDRFILQYDDGETKVVNITTHKGDIISKPGSVSTKPNESFGVVKDTETEFVVADGYVWFTAHHWGLVGYKAP